METKTCGTCTRPVGQPWRSHDPATGKIIHGCVDKCHTPALRGIISESARWHFRPEAKRIRSAEARHMRAIHG